MDLTQKKTRLLFLSSSDKPDEPLVIKKDLLKDFPSLTIHTNLFDAHLYMFSKWTLSILEKYYNSEQKIDGIKNQLLPFLVRCQYHSELVQGITIHNPLTLAFSMTSSPYDPEDKIKCLVYMMEEHSYCARAKTIAQYLEMNRDIATGTKSYKPAEPVGKNNFIADTAQVNEKTQVGTECVVGSQTKIGERCGIKKSCIGNNCKVGNNVKIINSVIMDNVEIMDSCNIQGSVICNNALVGEKATIIESMIGSSFQVPSKRTSKKEVLCVETQ